MEVRDAVEADAGSLAEMSASPTEAMRNIIHDRTVRVAVERTVEADSPDDGEPDHGVDSSDEAETDDDEPSTGDDIRGFVSFDAHVDTVHVTQLAGDPEVCTRLLDEPISFAKREGMAVELLVPSDDSELTGAAEDAGFENVGTGPRFDSQPTVKFRLET